MLYIIYVLYIYIYICQGKFYERKRTYGCFKPGDGDGLVNMGRDYFGLLKERRNNTNEEERACNRLKRAKGRKEHQKSDKIDTGFLEHRFVEHF